MSRTSDALAARSENFIRFEVRDGIRRVTCAVLDDALEAAAGLATPSTLSLRRRSFDRFRTLIDAAALMKLKTLPTGSAGMIVLTRSDLRSVPPQNGVPSFGTAQRGMTPPVLDMPKV
jgi:hypothetical protein